MEKGTILLGSPTQLTVVIEVTLDAHRIPLLMHIPWQKFATHRTGQEFLKEVAKKIDATFEEFQDFHPLSKEETALFWATRAYWKEKHRVLVPKIEI